MATQTQHITIESINKHFADVKKVKQISLDYKDMKDHIWNLFQHLGHVNEPDADLLHTVCCLVREFDLDYKDGSLSEELEVKVEDLLENPAHNYHDIRDLETVARWTTWQR